MRRVPIRASMRPGSRLWAARSADNWPTGSPVIPTLSPAVVTHASLWALDQFSPTTDHAYYWRREMTPEMTTANSPHRYVHRISTPMLVIHGDKDYRVPIGEALRLWYELLASSALPAGEDGSSPHRFLYFPSEDHWVVAPQHAKIWYQEVLAFLAEHVLGERAEL